MRLHYFKANKARVPVLALILLFSAVTACKKDDSGYGTNYSTIYGKWTISKVKAKFWNVGSPPEYDSVNMGGANYCDFRTDGKMYSYTDVTYSGPVLSIRPKYDTTPFIVQGKDSIFVSDNRGNSQLFLVQDFAPHSMVLYTWGSIGFGNYEDRAYYTR